MNEDLSSLFDKFNINKDSISPEAINNLMNIIGNNSSNSSEQTYNNYSNDNSNNSRGY